LLKKRTLFFFNGVKIEKDGDDKRSFNPVASFLESFQQRTSSSKTKVGSVHPIQPSASLLLFVVSTRINWFKAVAVSNTTIGSIASRKQQPWL